MKAIMRDLCESFQGFWSDLTAGVVFIVAFFATVDAVLRLAGWLGLS